MATQETVRRSELEQRFVQELRQMTPEQRQLMFAIAKAMVDTQKKQKRQRKLSKG